MDNTTNSLAEKSRLRQMIDSYGVPRMIITGFLLTSACRSVSSRAFWARHCPSSLASRVR